jgi:hypothetical protein
MQGFFGQRSPRFVSEPQGCLRGDPLGDHLERVQPSVARYLAGLDQLSVSGMSVTGEDVGCGEAAERHGHEGMVAHRSG